MEGLGMRRDFWNGKRVFITGHTGFKGSWMSLWLQALGVELTGYALPPLTTPNLFKEARVYKNMTSIEGDVRDLSSLHRAMESAEPEVIIHMAAQSLVRHSYQAPVETYGVNVMGTVNMLEAVRNTAGVRAIVNITTDKCYENKEWMWGYREPDMLGGFDPYSNSKACSELVSAAYRSSFFNVKDYEKHKVALATVRAGNVIGGGDWAEDRLIPDILRALSNKKLLYIRNPHSIRPWQHVLEPLHGYLTLAEKLVEEGPKYAEAWNFGPRDEDTKPVKWIVEKIIEEWGESIKYETDSVGHPHEARYLKLDISKAEQSLDWYPRLDLYHALKLTIEWSKKYQNGGDAHLLTLNQIKSYEQLI